MSEFESNVYILVGVGVLLVLLVNVALSVLMIERRSRKTNILIGALIEEQQETNRILRAINEDEV